MTAAELRPSPAPDHLPMRPPVPSPVPHPTNPHTTHQYKESSL